MNDHSDPSQSSLHNATRSRASFSGHGKSLGAAGKRVASFDPKNATELKNPGQSIAISPHDHPFEEILIGVAWDQITITDTGLLGKLFKKQKTIDVDLDIGCLYEMQDGSRGAVQAFGEKWGAYNQSPFIHLPGDEREGDEEGHDETLHINGAHWNEIKRVLIYIYIYKGASHWAEINPQIMIDVPGEKDLYVTLGAYDEHLDLCSIGSIENVRNGIKLTNHTEYFPGHEEMDRAFGFGLNWSDGKKRPY